FGLMTKAGASSPGRPLSLTTARIRLASDRPSECQSPGLAVVTGCDTKNVREPPIWREFCTVGVAVRAAPEWMIWVRPVPGRPAASPLYRTGGVIALTVPWTGS